MIILKPIFNPKFFNVEETKNLGGVYSQSGDKIISTNNLYLTPTPPNFGGSVSHYSTL